MGGFFFRQFLAVAKIKRQNFFLLWDILIKTSWTFQVPVLIKRFSFGEYTRGGRLEHCQVPKNS